jgi:hypothetical protein
MIPDEFHNFLANADVFSNITVKHMPGTYLIPLIAPLHLPPGLLDSPRTIRCAKDFLITHDPQPI